MSEPLWYLYGLQDDWLLKEKALWDVSYGITRNWLHYFIVH